jgi:hypothetical protein
MRRAAVLIATVAALAVVSLLPADAAEIKIGNWNHGCFRLGETGYHHYDFCLGPDFLYPHEHVCDKGSCYYR